MRNSLSSPKILKTADFQTYDCNIHTHNELDLSPLDMNSKKNKSYLTQSRDIQEKDDIKIKNSKELRTCKEICDCPCHCVSCICCPGVSNQPAPPSDYYKNLYFQIKSELDIERKRNDRIKYTKKMNENNLEKIKKEKDALFLENNKLKMKLNEVLNKFKQENIINMQEEIDRIKSEYETMIEQIKNEGNKQINFLNEKINMFNNENLNLKSKLKKKNFNEDKIISDLNNKIEELKSELDNSINIIEQLKNENEELTKDLDELNHKFNMENNDLNNNKQNEKEIHQKNKESEEEKKEDYYSDLSEEEKFY